MNSGKQIKKNMKMNAICVNCVIDVILSNISLGRGKWSGTNYIDYRGLLSIVITSIDCRQFIR